MSIPTELHFDHLLRMTDDLGTFEHARFTTPRPEHGYCTDDMARVLVVASREPDPSPAVRDLRGLALEFLRKAQDPSGAYRNRMDRDGRWEDDPTTDDCWGRSIWGLGTAAAHADDDEVRAAAIGQLERAVRRRSPYSRATAFGCLGAAELLTVIPGHRGARGFIADYADTLSAAVDDEVDPAWAWPEPRLHYANAALAEARIACGHALGRDELVRDGLHMLSWLIADQTAGGHLSPSPSAGRGAGDRQPAFDQQPIEVSTLADACSRAAAVDGRSIWSETVLAAAAWFDGANDLGLSMWDAATGGGFDGLHGDRVNRNQGAESTLAVLSTMQQARRHSMTPQ